uniref:zinc finger MYM-type protein 1-like n=1 Tax=Fragaria vesca subsp. vesca TaxID=101020 RepID=UPI0005C99A38|nr:PREDICTED: zinc finger MYM-type protein 1-like [Fragaria vesca subsp. vesca]
MTDHRKPKRYKSLFSWFQTDTPPSGSESGSVSENRRGTENSVNDVPMDVPLVSSISILVEECRSERIEVGGFDITSLERDPRLRRPICQYPLNDQENVKRAYVMDKAYCFPCFLFDRYPSHHPTFTFQGWKNIMSKQSGILKHMGGINSPHNAAMHKWETLRNPIKHIERVISTHSSQEAANHRLRLIATIEGVRLLAKQGCAFRRNDESADSTNRGNFDAVLSSFGRMNLEVQRVFDNAPGNAKYTSPLIQKQIVNILGNKVREKIRDEVGSAKFCILVDEAVDASSKEQMTTLYSEISKVLTHNDLQIENMRAQGYDGASNMRGEFNGLQALFCEECLYAYYVHCFAHHLQLALNAAAKGVDDIYTFFGTLSFVVNFVYYSAKRHSALKATREEEIAELVAVGKLQTGTGANQACTLQRAGAIR